MSLAKMLHESPASLDDPPRKKRGGSRTRKPSRVVHERLVSWQREPPSESGLWWWWNGDGDCAPIPLNIAYSGHTDSHFIMAGQYGIREAEDVADREGWWKRLYEPELPANVGDEPPLAKPS